MNGVLVINKPMDFTSFDVVAVMRKATGQRKIGHLGTLDPNATGVLPLVLGNATKAQDLVVNHDKSYTATFKLGIKTDTLDIWGTVLKQEKTYFTREDIEEKLPLFTGDILQTPPMYSAIQIDGKRLYDLARQGKTIDREKRPVTIYKLALTDFDEENQCGTLEISCSKGTYVRTIIDDLGGNLGSFAVMTSLIRTEACGYTLEQAIPLEKAREMTDFSKCLMNTESLFMSYPYIKISEAQAKRFSNGGSLDKNRTYLQRLNLPDDTIIRVKDANNAFLGLGIIKGDQLKIFKLFKTI
ncbi:MAG: tRNA pseudouridine(55) synthase TruB [Oscillospiraceae bacterium]|nr:tRNA pseudouridine(55) synthase TruB [Oscillospiraceae bacterium]